MLSPEPIAIIGMGCRFPGSSDTPSKLWDLLNKPRDVLKKVPNKRRWNAEAFYHTDPEHHGTSNVQHSYFLDEDPADFDNNFFNIQPAEAESIDPQQRMLIETVYESLCAAGQTIEGLRGSQTAIIVGAMGDDWSGAIYKDWEALPQYAATGAGRSIMANRISYFFDWHGASIALDTACSSSLVAVHLGIQAIHAGESRVAVAAGTNLILTPALYMAESNLHMVSDSGRSKMWNKGVDGYGRGEGVAAVVLKSLSAAIADGDHIEGIIRATGINQDGKSSGMTMPNPLAQAELIRATYARAGLDLDKPADRPQFFHAHGTGTPAGDPREAEAIARAFYSNGATDKLYVGSIKTIIGHTEGTAGLASLIGSVLAIQNSTIPPNMHFEELNPRIAPFYDNLEVPTTAKPWPKVLPGAPRRASVNSFGFGGTNAHAIVESYEGNSPIASTGSLFTPITVSAATGKSLRELIASYSEYLKLNPQVSLLDFAYTLQERRSTLAYRTHIAASTIHDCIAKMDALLEAKDVVDFNEKHFNFNGAKILGVFTGQGAQWPRMGARLVESSPFMESRLAYLDSVLAGLPKAHAPEWNLKEQLLRHGSSSRVYEAALSQPLCTAVQLLLVDFLELAGVKLSAVVGHSSGEIAAAYAAGFLSAKDAIVTAYYRGFYTKLAKSPTGAEGAMMAVGTSLEDATEFCELDEFQGRIQVAAHNSPSSITLTGDMDAIDMAVNIFKDEKKFVRKLKVDTAYHSLHMLPCAAPYLAAVEAQAQDTHLPTKKDAPIWYSSVYKGKIMSPQDVNAEYWIDNLINPVMFAPAILEAAHQSGPFDLAIEVGPHPALKGPCLDTLEEVDNGTVPYLGVLGRGKDDILEMATSLGSIWSVLGAGSVSFTEVQRVLSGRKGGHQSIVSNLPKYPWDHSRQYWKLSRLSGFHINLETPPNPLLGRRCIDRDTSDKIQWRNMLRPKEVPWLRSHQLQGQIVFPASGYISMAVEAITAVVAPPRQLSIINVDDFVIDRGIPFADDNFVVESLFVLDDLRSSDDSITAKFSLYCGNPYDGSRPMTIHASGHVSAVFGAPRPDSLLCTKMDEFNMTEIDIDRFYGQFEPVRYKYTEPFRGIRSIKRKSGCATGTLEDQTGSEWQDQLLIHPAMLDSAFQTGFAAWCCPGDGQLWCVHVPSRIRSVSINPYFTSRGIGKQKLMSWDCWLNYDGGSATQDTTLYSEDNYYTFIQVQGLEAVPVSAANAQDDVPLFSRFDHRVDRPSGIVAAIDDPPVLHVDDAVIESDRLALYHLRQLTETITPQERQNTLPHYQHVLKWADHVIENVKMGKNEFLSVDCLQDTEDRFVPFLAKNGHRVDIRLIQSVGQNIPKAIRQSSSILEYMTKDGMLDSIYEEGLGLDQPNRCMARMAGQLAHRYPRMNVFEIGAGTGGSTRYILPKLAQSFSTYTYTDISSGFFEAAQDRFHEYSDRMMYKTYNMNINPADQGFIPGSYDLVLASYVLHATDELEQMMTNIRTLLKPGGYLIVQELTSNDVLRISLPMAGLPGWWTGAENGRPWGPALSLTQWNDLLLKCGFSGIDSVTPKNHALYPDAVFIAQAMDDRVSILRSPITCMESLAPPTAPQLLIVGGETTTTNDIADGLEKLLARRYSKLVRIRSFKDLSADAVVPNSSMIVLSELDQPLMASPALETHAALQLAWRESGIVLWVCQGSRAEQPHSFMMVGLGRCVRYEYPNITLQILDLDKIEKDTTALITEEFLRLEALSLWEKEATRKDLLWSIEPEVYLEQNMRIIPRLAPNVPANNRHNTTRRTIIEQVNPQKSSLVFTPTYGNAYEPQLASPLRLPTLPPVSGETKTIYITHFMLQTMDIAFAGRVLLCAGVDKTNGEKVIALSHALESPIPALAEFTLPLGDRNPKKTLGIMTAHITASNILKTIPQGGSLIIHEPDALVYLELRKQASANSVNISVTTSLKDRPYKSWLYIHSRLPKRSAIKILPSSPSVFFDMSVSLLSVEAGKLIRQCIPQHCPIYTRGTLFGSQVEFRPQANRIEVIEQFKAAFDASTAADDSVAGLPVIPLEEASQHSSDSELLAIIDCCSPLVPARVQGIDSGIIFQSDKTYFLVGLATEVGQSICKWMVEHGARHVVLTSRRPKVAPKFIQSMEDMGANIRVLPCDVTNRDALQSCYKEICLTMPPIAGVANGAMVLKDALFDKMTLDELTTVLNPKVIGTQLLDEIFYNTPLDFFIVLSSLTATVGNSGQSNYTCANMYMVALTAQRKKRGLAGSAMGMSSLIGIGFVERSEELDEDYFSKLGHNNISERDLHEQFAEAILVGRPEYVENSELVSGLVPIYADAKVKARWRTDSRFNHFVMERPGSQTYAGQVVDMPVRARLVEVKALDEASGLIKESFLARLKRIMMVSDEDNVNDKVSLVEQGIDSLMAVEIRTWFLKELDVDIPVLKVISGASILDLLAFALENIPKSILDINNLDASVAGKAVAKTPSPGIIAVAAPDQAQSRAGAVSSSTVSDSTAQSTPPRSITPLETPMNEPKDDHIALDKAHRDVLIGPMSYGQERFWFLNEYLEDKNTFNMAMMFKLTGELDVERVEAALATVAQRHEALRTRFFWSGEGDERIGMQGIVAQSSIHLVSKSIVSEAEAEQEMQNLYAYKWDLGSSETAKVLLLSLSDNVHYLVCGAHHISLDGYSLSLLFVELEFAYSGRPLPPITSKSQCRALAADQRQRYQTGAMSDAIDYYRSIVPVDLKPIELFSFAKARTRPVLDRYGHFEAKAKVDTDLAARIKLLARKNNSTAFHVYLAALETLIFSHVTDMDEFFIGIADANRKEKDYIHSLGFFLNLLPLYFKRSEAGVRIGTRVAEARDKAYAALEHSDMPFDILLQELNIRRSNTHTPLFQVFVDYRQVYQERALWGGCKTSNEKWCNSRTGYDVALEITENPTGPSLLSLRLQDGLYSKKSTELLLRSLINILDAMTKSTDALVSQLPHWDQRDIDSALKVGKGPELKLKWPPTISHRVDQMITAHENKPALKDGLGTNLSYREMGVRIQTIATALVEAGATSGTKIGVFQEPSSDWICSMLAILRVGAIYIPLDLRNSIPRLVTIGAMSQLEIIITDLTTTTKRKLIRADGITEINVTKLETRPSLPLLPNNADPDAIAVVLFTSGTTGTPKGVMMKHSNLAAECEAYSSFCNLPAGNSVVMQQSIFSFDFSIEQTFVALADGGCLYVVPSDKRGDPLEISKLMLEEGVTYTSGTPSEYEMLLKYAPETLSLCKSWKFAFGGGEYLSPSLIKKFAQLPLPGLRLFNNYGPAEVTTAAVKGEIHYRDGELEPHTMAGFILPNYRMYFVDAQLNPVPIGVPGEIVVGGPGVTAGYLGADDLTKTHYIPDKFDTSSENGRLYRTGDLGHLREDGAVYWNSRIYGDTQVKLRGFRIELAEVEAMIVNHAVGSLQGAIVTLRGNGDESFLAAHVVFSPDYPQNKRQDQMDRLKRDLPLPSYMRPSIVVSLSEMPLTAHLKVDRHAIRAMPLPESYDTTNKSAQLTEMEKKLAELWHAVIPHGLSSQLTPTTDFFNVGGNSLLLVKLQSLVRLKLGAIPRLIDLMNASTLADMVTTISACEQAHTIDWNEEISLPPTLYSPKSLERVQRPNDTSQNLTVVLAGATGHLGKRILSVLVQAPQIKQIVCLSRGGVMVGGGQSHPKVKLVDADISTANLGLTNAAFSQLAKEANVVINCAANRSFWDSYKVLQPVNVGGVKELTKLSLANNAKLHVLSSGAVSTYQDIPPPTDGSDGYIASKWAAERFLKNAALMLGLQVKIHRPAPTNSPTVDASQALTSLINLMRSLGTRPDFATVGGYVDLAPISNVAESILASVITSDSTEGAGVDVVIHEGSMRVYTRDLAAHIESDVELNKLSAKSALEWFGDAKKAGFEFLITSQELTMQHEHGALLSRR